MSNHENLEEELARDQARLVDLAHEQAVLRTRVEQLRRQIAQAAEESQHSGQVRPAPLDASRIQESRAHRKDHDADRAANLAREAKETDEAERAEGAREPGPAAAVEDHGEESARDQQALDRVQRVLDAHQVRLDQDQSALSDLSTRSEEEEQTNRSQRAQDRGQADQNRNQAALDRAQAALDRKFNERRNYLIDDVTGMLRRGPGLRELQHEIDRARRQEVRLVVAFIDVDGLKAFNDRRGHAAGDQLLEEVGQALRDGLRSYDLVLRYGGDEFVCALSDAEIGLAESRLREVADLLRAAPSGGSISWGVAELQAGDTLDSLVARADSSLYRRRSRRDSPASKKKQGEASGDESGRSDGASNG